MFDQTLEKITFLSILAEHYNTLKSFNLNPGIGKLTLLPKLPGHSNIYLLINVDPGIEKTRITFHILITHCILTHTVT